MQIRPELMRFVEHMEAVLRANDHKGDTTHGFRPDEALERIWDEVRELDRATFGINIYTPSAKVRKMQGEALDVANFALLFWLGCEAWIEESKETVTED